MCSLVKFLVCVEVSIYLYWWIVFIVDCKKFNIFCFVCEGYLVNISMFFIFIWYNIWNVEIFYFFVVSVNLCC